MSWTNAMLESSMSSIRKAGKFDSPGTGMNICCDGQAGKNERPGKVGTDFDGDKPLHFSSVTVFLKVISGRG